MDAQSRQNESHGETVSDREEFANRRPSRRVCSHEKVGANENSKEDDLGSQKSPDSQLDVWNFPEWPAFHVALLVHRKSLAAVTVQRDYAQYRPIRDKWPEGLVANRRRTACLSYAESEEKEERCECHN